MRAGRRTVEPHRDHGRAESATARRPVHYPESDGKPMGETPVHRDEMIRLVQALQARYAADEAVYVSGNMMLYYVEGDPHISVSPDVFVTLGIPKRPERETYKTWQEFDKPPTFIIEITSSSTRLVDRRRKWELYARLGVQEYVLYDPANDPPRRPWLSQAQQPPRRPRAPSLEGYQLAGGQYEPLAVAADGALISEALDLRLLLEQGRLQLFEQRTGLRLLGGVERAEWERERAEWERERAEQEQERAEWERERAEREAELRRAAEARIAELEALLARQPPRSP